MALVYHTIADVQALLAQQQILIASGSQPSQATVTTWGEMIEAVVEGRIATRYPVPVSSVNSPKAFGVIKQICANLTAARVWRAVFSGAQESETHSYADHLEEMSEELLKAIAEGINVLPDATAKVALPEARIADPLHSFDTSASPEFKVGDVP